MRNGRSMDSIQSSYTNGSSSPGPNMESDVTPDEQEDKARLISQVLELQNTLDDLSQRVDSVKEENLKLKSENQVLGQYIENLMSGNIINFFACYLMNIYFPLLFSASSVFQSTSPNSKKK